MGKKNLISVTLSLIAIIAISFFCFQCYAEEPEKDFTSNTSVSDSPLKINISAPKDEFIIGEMIPIDVFHKNISDKSIKVLDLGIVGQPLAFDVVDSKGNHSVTCIAPRIDVAVNWEEAFIKLNSGETFEKQYNLNEWFDFKEPDIYKVTAGYSSLYGLPGTHSNTIQIRLIKK